MKRIYTVATALTLVMATTAMSQNLLTNPGFESSGDGWTLFTQGGSPAVASVTYPNTGAHGGTRYARVEVTTPAASAAENWHVQFQPPTGWEAGVGATYEFKFWAKSDSSSNIHVSVQGADYTYLTGTSFGLTSDWTEYSFSLVSDAEGTSAVRFHIYVAEAVNAYSFDDVSVTALTSSIRGSASAQGRGLNVRQGRDHLVLALDAGITGTWTAELVDLRGSTLASAQGRGNGSVQLARPTEPGAYMVRARTANRTWVRKILIP